MQQGVVLGHTACCISGVNHVSPSPGITCVCSSVAGAVLWIVLNAGSILETQIVLVSHKLLCWKYLLSTNCICAIKMDWCAHVEVTPPSGHSSSQKNWRTVFYPGAQIMSLPVNRALKVHQFF